MAYRCSVCGQNTVSRRGGVCEMCSIGADTQNIENESEYHSSDNTSSDDKQVYNNTPTNDFHRTNKRKIALGTGNSESNSSGNSISNGNNSQISVYSNNHVPVYQNANQVPIPVNNTTTPTNSTPATSKGLPLASGIAKNVNTDTMEISKIEKFMKSLISGIPYSHTDDITMFQVYPDSTGTGLNAQGNACDQVIVYGKITNGLISDNNHIEIYGKRDSKNNIIARKIRNVASGTIIEPTDITSATVIRALASTAAIVFIGIIGACSSMF